MGICGSTDQNASYEYSQQSASGSGSSGAPQAHRQLSQDETRKTSTAIGSQADHGLITAARRGDAAGVYQMLDQGASINFGAGLSNTVPPIHEALLNGHEELACTMVALGARCDVKEPSGFTPLIIAARKQMNDAAAAIVGSGEGGTASVNEQDKTGRTALHYAALKYNRSMIGLLLSAGALSTIKDSRGKAPTDPTTDKGGIVEAEARKLGGGSYRLSGRGLIFTGV